MLRIVVENWNFNRRSSRLSFILPSIIVFHANEIATNCVVNNRALVSGIVLVKQN